MRYVLLLALSGLCLGACADPVVEDSAGRRIVGVERY